ncbi:hypothetical protein AMJ80_00615 [bacterium SM23_31]|nr:MAG: hypothetical protein AMJ80_00615 [bacterium SM23_31]
MQNKRKQRVAGLIKVNLSQIIQREIAGRLPGMATIMHVDLSDDLKYAKVNVSLYGSEKAKEKSFAILKRETKNLRKRLGQVLNLRQIPVLAFVEDSTLDHAFRIDEILAKIHQNEKNSGKPDAQ